MRIGLVVEYDGTEYHGFQYQANVPTVQEELEKAIAGLTGEQVRINGAGRTDAGVHAKGQVVAFDTHSTYSTGTFVKAMNHYLPDDVAVKAAYGVRLGFDPRRDALRRSYRYSILNGPTPSPLSRRTACLIAERLDIGIIEEAAKLFVGIHDFALFAGPLPEGRNGTVREIFGFRVESGESWITLDVEGNAFLPHQVRRMAGAIIDAGRYRLAIDDLKKMIDREKVGAVAHSLAAKGLCLMEVTYQNFPPKVGESDGIKC